ncbi:MAG TPA: M2 family metallopeptidase [Myxococcales bacterium]|nr:M2 family metallopeptidase [Myxococcales bacterium]
MRFFPLCSAALVLSCASSSSRAAPSSSQGAAPASADAAPDPASAKEFVSKTNDDLLRLSTRSNTAEWIKSTYITEDTERLAADANEVLLGYNAAAVKTAARWNGAKLDPETARMLYLLRTGSSLAAPADPRRRLELTTLAARLEGLYGKGKYCKGGKCRDLEELSDVIGKSRDPKELLDAWTGWHAIAREMRPLYTRFVELANEGAREIGFSDTGAMWRAGYDMPPEQFPAEMDRLWAQVKPLYDDLHCYVRGRLQEKYGKDAVKDDAPIPAHLLGNMWAQEWTKIYPLVEPYPDAAQLDVTSAMTRMGLTPEKMMAIGMGFFTSIGFPELPRTFWTRSLMQKPRDRDVVCHASAWDIDGGEDVRIKMCVKIEEEDLVTIHHELGHLYYNLAYAKQPFLFRAGANDGFHEAIGDTIALSVTPGYLRKLRLIAQEPRDEHGLVDVQLKEALDKVAFLPFGLLIDRWRWEVFSGKVTPDRYDSAWWELRRRYQGVAPPVERSEADFDPGAKYHVPANVPYSRYFLARILQFQFHRALCKAAGFQGPLHACSIHNSVQAGEPFWKMLSLGASRPWQDALETLTGQRQMDAGAMLEYFAPLAKWLSEQNRGRRCGF